MIRSEWRLSPRLCQDVVGEGMTGSQKMTRVLLSSFGIASIRAQTVDFFNHFKSREDVSLAMKALLFFVIKEELSSISIIVSFFGMLVARITPLIQAMSRALGFDDTTS
jgi:hypothetical protein